MCKGVLLVCLYITSMSGACRGQKKVSAPLELVLQMVVRHRVGLGTKPRFSGRVNNGDISPVPSYICM